MFGWEFPPKIYGGLAVASYGITKGLSLQGDVETTFCMPKPCGEEEGFLKIVNMSQVPVVWRDVQYDWIKDRFVGHTTASVTTSTQISTICKALTTWAAYNLRGAIPAISMTRSITSL